MFSAVFDACVIYPNTLRDFLLTLAYDGLIMPFWSEEILGEWTRNLLENRPDLTLEKLERTRRKMDSHFPKSLIREYESHIPTLQLPDPKDTHVLAVAIHAKAECIVTLNRKDFPPSVLQRHNIEVLSPDEIIWRVIQRKPARVIAVVQKHRLGLTRPPMSATEYLAMLEKQGLLQTVAFLREHEREI